MKYFRITIIFDSHQYSTPIREYENENEIQQLFKFCEDMMKGEFSYLKLELCNNETLYLTTDIVKRAHIIIKKFEKKPLNFD